MKRKQYVVYGPPGTGKTTYQLRKVSMLREAGVDADDIAYLSHTRAAAAEALSRLGVERSDKVSTIHAMCFRACNLSRSQVVQHEQLREFSDAIGVPITGRSPESEDEKLEEGDEYLSVLSYARNKLIDPLQAYEEFGQPGHRQTFQVFCKGYQQWKDAYGLIDFTDMLTTYLHDDSLTPAEVRAAFLDEAQDLTPLQWLVFEKLARHAEQVHIAGDDDQAIYTWAGADPDGMYRFEEQYDSDRKVLPQSYRVPHIVHDLAHRIIQAVAGRVDKEYRPRDEEGRVVRAGAVSYIDPRLLDRDTLVLYRNHAMRDEVEGWLKQNGVPYLSISGRPAPLQTQLGKVIKAHHQLQQTGKWAGGDGMAQMAAKFTDRDKVRKLLLDHDWAQLAKMNWESCYRLPWWAASYFPKLDLDQEPKVRISSIHGSKGREAEHVVLLLGMTGRTAMNFAHNPDPEHRVFYVGTTRTKHTLTLVDGEMPYPIDLRRL